MTYRTFFSALIFMGLLVGCNERDVPTEAVTPDFGEAGSSGCYTVNYTLDPVFVGVFPEGVVYVGTLSEDLEGSTYAVFQPSSFRFAGVTMKTGEGVVSYTITGGIIPELVGQSFTVAQENLNLFVPDNDPNVIINRGKARAIDGVEKANLTFRGETELGVATHLEFNGVICP